MRRTSGKSFGYQEGDGHGKQARLRVGVAAADGFRLAGELGGEVGQAGGEEVAIALLLFPLGLGEEGKLLVWSTPDLAANGSFQFEQGRGDLTGLVFCAVGKLLADGIGAVAAAGFERGPQGGDRKKVAEGKRVD